MADCSPILTQEGVGLHTKIRVPHCTF